MAKTRGERGAVVVTGASSGIGADLARVFAREGREVVLVARSRPPLEALARELEGRHGVRAHVIPADLAAPHAAASLHAAVADLGIEVDTLVNDAGFGMRGEFVSLDADRQTEMMQLNVVALTELCRLYAPGMVRRGGGAILNVASTGAFQPGPLMAVYCATKAYVLSFSEALADELRRSGVTVTCVCPGPTATGFGEKAGVSGTWLFRSARPMTSAAVAEAACRALARRAPLHVPGLRNRIMAASARLVTIRTAARVARLFLGVPRDAARAPGRPGATPAPGPRPAP